MHRSKGTKYSVRRNKSLLTLCLSLLLASAAAPAFADAYADGVNQLNSRKFPQAIVSFQSALKANPKNSMAQYYLALAMHYKGDTQGALTAYSKVLTTFPGSNASQLAVRGMASIDPSILQKLGLASPQSQPASRAASSGSRGVSNYGGGGPIGGTAASNPGDYIPDECRVYCTRESNCLVLDARISNRPIKMIFDTGAESTVLGKNHLAELGLPAPTGNPIGTTMGVGEGGGQRCWQSNLEITVGNITRKNFPIVVQEHMPTPPLLGQSFFNQMRYTIDNNSIHFVKKTTGGGGSIYSRGSNNPNAVPFTKEGNEMVVMVEVNGTKIPMYFDTGASGVALAPQHLRQLGLTIPDDARTTVSTGIAGNTMGKAFPVRTIKLGPIEKRDFEIDVVASSNMPHPLLGQTFFGDYQYTIDYDNKLIHFVRR